MALSIRDNMSLGSAGLAIGFTTSKAKSVNALDYVINGRAYQKAATDDLFTLSGTALAANQVCAFFLLLDSSGTASVQQSSIAAASTAASGYQAGAFEWPDVADKAVIGALLIKSGGSAFTPGTTALTGVTTYINAAVNYSKAITY